MPGVTNLSRFSAFWRPQTAPAGRSAVRFVGYICRQWMVLGKMKNTSADLPQFTELDKGCQMKLRLASLSLAVWLHQLERQRELDVIVFRCLGLVNISQALVDITEKVSPHTNNDKSPRAKPGGGVR